MLQAHEIILAIIPTLINPGAPPLMDVIALNTQVGFFFRVHVAPASKNQHVYRVCMCAFCCRGNTADAGSSWDHVAK